MPGSREPRLSARVLIEETACFELFQWIKKVLSTVVC